MTKIKKILSKGKWHFILVYCVLFWGLTTAILFSGWQHLLGKESFLEALKSSLIVFPLGGVLIELWLWGRMDKLYKKDDPSKK